MKLPKLPYWSYWSLIFVPVLLIYLKFIKIKVENLYGPKIASGILSAIIIIYIAGILFDSFSLIFSGFSNPFLGSGKTAQRILKTGTPAMATVLYLGENSKGGVVTINDQPYLNIKLKIDNGKNPPYEISFDTIIPRSDMPQFQPGAIFPVKIDPNNPELVSIDNEALNDIYIADYDNKINEEDKKIILEKGIDAAAKIISIEDTGESKDYKPVIKTTWEIVFKENDKYNIIVSGLVTTEQVDQIKKLLNIPFQAKVHPDNKNKVKIKFNV